MKILWIDDQLEVVKTLSSAILHPTWTVRFAATGEEAINLLKSTSYDVILLDLSMPPGRWGGLWVLEQISKFKLTATPVIVVSGEGAQAETIQALRLGATNYVLKENIDIELVQQILDALSKQQTDIDLLIAAGESSNVEFKSTLRINLHTSLVDKAMELACLKTISAFLNTTGGTLIIGLSDDGSAIGIDIDGFKNEDKFQLHFWNIFREAIGPDYSEFVKPRLSTYQQKKIFIVECKPATRPVFLRWKIANESQARDHFFVRAGPQTESLDARHTYLYITDHFSSNK